MGNLYYGCKKCKGGLSIFGQFIGFIKCVDCNRRLDDDPGNYEDSKFSKHIIRCPQCNFTASFESMGDFNADCLKCQSKMFEGYPVTKGASS